ncbi:MAG: hypothetical protein KDB22_26360 [Planctomycetales bacterium]|nr:hypothetical protein [Planctomycetales bacterium]
MLVFSHQAAGGIVLGNAGFTKEASRIIETAEKSVLTGDTARALNTLQLLANQPDTLAPDVMLFQLMAEAGMREQAKKHLEQFTVRSSPRFDTFLAFSRMAVLEKRWFDAFVHGQLALRQPTPDNWSEEFSEKMKLEALLVLMESSEARGSWAQVREAIQMCDVEKASDPRLLHFLAKVELFDGNMEKAEERFRVFSRALPEQPAPLVLIAEEYVMKGDSQNAELFFRKACDEKDPQVAGLAKLKMAAWLIDQNRIEHAERTLADIDIPASKEIDALLLRVIIHRSRQEFDRAQQILTGLRLRTKDNFAVNNQLALVLSCSQLQEEQEEALDLAAANAKQFPGVPDAFATLGWTNLVVGNLQAAERNLTASTSTGIISRDTAFYFSELYERLGEKNQAERMRSAARDGQGPFIFAQRIK